MKKLVVYTAIFGGYDGLLPQPRFKNVDYICFTDQPIKSKTWDVRVVTPPYGKDNTRNNRYFKILPHKHFPGHDVSIYIDGNFIVKKNPTSLLDKLESFGMLTFDHNQTQHDKRDCVYKEYEAILKEGELNNGNFKDDPAVMKQQIDRFHSEGYPEENGLIFAAVLIRMHHRPNVKKVMEDWWSILTTESKRDQLSFNYVAWKNNFNFGVLDGDLRRGNPWFHSIGKHNKNYRKKIFTYRLKRLLGKIK